MAESKEKRYKWRRDDYRENTKGLLMLNTGDGKGKTTAAIGVLVRAAGREMKCCMIQFMKSRSDRYGEHESFGKLGIEVHTMGDGFTWDTQDKSQDIKTSLETWALCVDKMRNGDYDLLVFDELLYVLSYGFIEIDAVIAEIRSIRALQPHLHLILTGRNVENALTNLIDEADLVTEMVEIKHPFNNGIYAQQGIEF
ncbi:MAG TPA: cob(I)yrinic acid a,c-diamide adenosyltransferase [Pyrinomonadaceae bacterium]|nr:cob(I)yrinic acid a,c-diamide adenosyltransferase [Chloracidobacterium sp.]MBP9934427.1 cob(I)yrinic acid a,c-diamide adenosyltransferase [Pyrinomonadaceae bacterium]MBK7802594.1 cob(I)yrinic acid a,c-diamide adenosyltransferase [Chloracidobacterium sp.]MBK9437445.1 cob(I)yrinic acid a,c-diamide adenosyltransferase [Chloracidobacterium sp.]MBK9766178.1 cob(I)yrinic acid a,c-diamide adenosyltransferase [Chloracidobacterium sp.]